MRDTDKVRFANILTGAAEYYGHAISSAVIRLWWDALTPYDIDAIDDAMRRYLVSDTGEFMPKIASLVKMIQGSSKDASMIAWTKVDKAVRQIGNYYDVVFDDPCIHKVITDMGGWVSLGQKTETEWPFLQKEFETRYKGYLIRDSIGEYQKQLTGLSNAHNRHNGYKLEEPRLIGDSDKCKQVLTGGIETNSIGLVKPKMLEAV